MLGVNLPSPLQWNFELSLSWHERRLVGRGGFVGVVQVESS